MKRLVVVLAVLLVLAVAAAVALSVLDQRIRLEAEQHAAERLARELPIEGTPVVEITGFPFVLHVLNDGSVEQLRVSMRSLESGGVRVDEAQLTIEGLILDRDALIESHEIKLVEIDEAKIEVWMTADDLSKVAEVPVRIDGGEVSVTVQGTEYKGTARVSKHAVLLLVDGAPPILSPLPSTDLLPCDPDLDIDGNRIHVACTVDEVPPAVARVLAQRG